MARNNEFKEIQIINCTYYYFDDMVNINDFNSKDIKVDRKSDIDILIHHIRYKTLDDVKPLIINFNKINGYFEDHNGSRHLALIPAGENKCEIKICKEAWNSIEDLDL